MTALSRSTRRKLSLLPLAEELGNVFKACRVMGYHRDTFYEVRRAFQVGGVNALGEREMDSAVTGRGRRRRDDGKDLPRRGSRQVVDNAHDRERQGHDDAEHQERRHHERREIAGAVTVLGTAQAYRQR